MQRWDYLAIANAMPDNPLALPSYLQETEVTDHWSIVAPVEDDQLANLASANATRASHQGPVSMFNLVACIPAQRPRFFGYIAAFAESVGSRYGGEAQLLGAGATDWSSREAEGLEVADPKAGGSGVWEDVALVWYPSLWHFAKLLDDGDYAAADREFKVSVLKDNPILCCTEVVL